MSRDLSSFTVYSSSIPCFSKEFKNMVSIPEISRHWFSCPFLSVPSLLRLVLFNIDPNLNILSLVFGFVGEGSLGLLVFRFYGEGTDWVCSFRSYHETLLVCNSLLFSTIIFKLPTRSLQFLLSVWILLFSGLTDVLNVLFISHFTDTNSICLTVTSLSPTIHISRFFKMYLTEILFHMFYVGFSTIFLGILSTSPSCI